jgi:DnaK suppressor protein
MMTRFQFEPGGAARPAEALGTEHFRSVLHEQRRFRLDQLRELAAPQAADDRLNEVSAALRSAARSALAEVEAALRRIEAGTFGRCVRCDRAILPERLEIVPMTSLCMPCQQRQERDTR